VRSDWKTAYYAQKKIADNAVAEHLEEQRTHVAIREHASIVAKMQEEQETLTQKCAAKVDELELRVAGVCCRAVGMTIKDDFEG
jgi:hypothetical protein